MLWLAEPDYERRTIMHMLRNGFIDGVIVSSMPVDEVIVDALARSTLPFVLVVAVALALLAALGTWRERDVARRPEAGT